MYTRFVIELRWSDKQKVSFSQKRQKIQSKIVKLMIRDSEI